MIIIHAVNTLPRLVGDALKKRLKVMPADAADARVR
jgi:hypothetical protein